MTHRPSPRWGGCADSAVTGQWALTAQIWGPPEHAGLSLGALLGIGGHGRAEALAVPARVARAGVMHTGLIEDRGVHLEEG